MTKSSIHPVPDPDESDNNQDKPSRFNTEKLREVARQYSAEGGFEGPGEIIEVPVENRPPEYFRVRDDDDYWTECMTLDYAPQGGRKETYYIAPELFSQGLNNLPPEILSEVKWSRIYTVMSRKGYITSLWRIKVHDSGPGQLSTRTALACADKAKNVWVKVVWHDRVGYKPYPARGDFGEPQWTDHTFEQLLEIAFKVNYIDSFDHPVMRDLLGEDV